MAQLQKDFAQYAHRYLLGRSPDEDSLRAAEDVIAMTARQAGAAEAEADARYEWGCPARWFEFDTERLEYVEFSCDEAFPYPLRWRDHPIARFKLRLWGHPGRCPIHSRKFEVLIATVLKMRMARPLKQVVMTVKVDGDP